MEGHPNCWKLRTRWGSWGLWLVERAHASNHCSQVFQRCILPDVHVPAWL